MESIEPIVADVLLLHGLNKDSRMMNSLGEYLRRHHYNTINIDYSPSDLPIEGLAERVLTVIESLSWESRPLYAVGHSLGAILIRYLYQMDRFPKLLSGVVMLGPPSHGSQLIDWLKRFSLFRRILGPAGQQLGTDKLSWPQRLPLPLPFPSMMITAEGVMWKSWPFSRFLLSNMARNETDVNDGWLLLSEQLIHGVPHLHLKGVAHNELPDQPDVHHRITLYFSELDQKSG